MLQCAVRLFSDSRWRQSRVVKTKIRHWTACECVTDVLPNFDVFYDLLVNRPRVTWNLYSLHNEQKRNIDILASYRFTVRGFVLDFQVVKNLSRFILFFFLFTPFAAHYVKIRNHLRETATNSAKIHSLARKYEHLRINQIQLRFLHFNQHSITLLGIHVRHWAYKREKCTFINANIKVINTILKVNRDNWHSVMTLFAIQ